MTNRPNKYRLIDFGCGRKLESLGGVMVDRPCPAAESVRKHLDPLHWQQAHLRFDHLSPSEWSGRVPSADWSFDHPFFRLQLRCTPAGQVGVFPEQRENWDWIAQQVRGYQAERGRTVRCLNLFAYTGATTLTLARVGGEVVHVDASKPAIAWARQNAVASGLSSAPIRWIHEDARRFVERELRRGSSYEVVVLDPPTYGHGKRGAAWCFEDHISELLDRCTRLLSDQPCALLWTGHTASDALEQWVHETTCRLAGGLRSACGLQRSHLKDEAGRDLDCGFVVRWNR